MHVMLVLMNRLALLGWLSALKHGGLTRSLSASFLHTLKLLGLEASLRTSLDVLKVVGSGSALGKVRLERELLLVLLILVVLFRLVILINLPASSVVQLLHNLFGVGLRVVIVPLPGDTVEIDGADTRSLLRLFSDLLSAVHIGSERMLLAELCLLLQLCLLLLHSLI